MVSEDDWKKLAKELDKIYQRPDAEPFRAPVAWKELGLVDYPQVISTPMDLGTVKDKLKKRSYTTPDEMHKDVQLVWSNCMTYNQDGSDFFKLAASLKQKWEKTYNKLVKDMNVKDAASAATPGATGEAAPAAAAAPTAAKSGGSAKASLADRRTFAKSLYQITKEDLGKVLVEVEQKCPAALKRNSTEDEIEFNVDVIPGHLLSELTSFINNAKKRKTGGSNKKAKTTKAAAAAAATASAS